MRNLKKLYQDFMRRRVDEKWLAQYNYVTVLGERFLNGSYVVVFEVDEIKELHYRMHELWKDMY